MIEQDLRLIAVSFPRNARCAVTTSWDDNERMNLDVSRILDSTQLKGTFYIDPGNPRNGGLTESEIRQLAETHEIGSHTWSHINMRKSDAITLRRELTESKASLEIATGYPIVGMAYPWGERSVLAERMVRECGYLYARTVEEGHVNFPPSNKYGWGVSVQALPRPRFLSRKAYTYVRNLAGDWRKLAVKLFERARTSRGAWHLFGHSWEVLREPELEKDLLEVFRHVAGREDVWYATNGMLFLNELIKQNVQIAKQKQDDRFVFSVRLPSAFEYYVRRTPIPLMVVCPANVTKRHRIEVTTSETGNFYMGLDSNRTWIDIFDTKAEVVITRS